MSTDPFFSLKGNVRDFDITALADALETSRHVCNVIYRPDKLDLVRKRIEGVTFENVSFSKTDIEGFTFKNCKFMDCLFIATRFIDVNFHSCSFLRSNFYKASFSKIYGKPEQFSGAVPSDQYANIGVHLYQELRDNYVDEAQPEFMREAEYQFKKWSQKLMWIEMRRKHGFKISFALNWLGLGVYRLLFGYGLRLRNLVVTTFISVLLLTILAKKYAPQMFAEGGAVTWMKSVYFTISTMVTMGAVGFTPISDAGYFFLILNAIVGVLLLSATLNAFSKRVSR